MAYRYKVRDSDGDISIIEFDFDYEKGLIKMEPESRQLIAVKGYSFPSDDDIVTSFEEFTETGEVELNDDEITKRTLLVMLTDEWCDTPKKVHETVNVFEIGMKMAYSVSAIKAISKKAGDDDIELPRIRRDGARFLWDSFVYVHEQGLALEADPDKKKDVESYVRNETGHDEFTIADAMPKAIGCWALPVKIYDDQDFIVVRVPYSVMEDIYDEWKEHHSTSFDGSALDGLPTNITDEINALFARFNKKHD